MNYFGALAACALLVQASSAPAAPPLQPLKKWAVDHGETVCTASRAYGSEAAPVVFALRPSPNGSVVRLLIARQGRSPVAQHFPVTTSITAQQVKTTGLRFGSSNRKSEIIWVNFARADLEGLSKTGEIALTAKGIINERFALPGIAAVLKALDQCNEDLRAHWNVEGAAGAPLTKTATSTKPLYSYFSDDDYPEQAMDESATGATRVMMMIDEVGKLRDCMVEETSGIATLDAMTCGVLLERAKFSPALDASGKPVRSVLTTRISWKIAS